MDASIVPVQVAACMSRPVITATPDSSLLSALHKMRTHGVHRLPVVDPHRRLAGLICERDLLMAVSSSEGGSPLWESGIQLASLPVHTLMSRAILTVGESTSLYRAGLLMVRNQIGALPVLDRSNRLVGIITRSDIFRQMTARLLDASVSTSPNSPMISTSTTVAESEM